MSFDAAPRSDRPRRRDNGLTAAAYVPLADVAAELGDELLTALRRAGIPAYLQVPESAGRARLYVSADDRSDARTVVASAARASQTTGPPSDPPLTDPLDALDTDAEFAAIVADWNVDTIAALRAAERDLASEDADWRARLEMQPAAEDEHYVPPPPPPLPRLSALTVWALVIIALSIATLAFGGLLGLPFGVVFPAAVAGILIGAGMLVMRLRDRPDEDDGDDGAVV